MQKADSVCSSEIRKRKIQDDEHKGREAVGESWVVVENSLTEEFWQGQRKTETYLPSQL